jgi:hypothetical protein
MNTPTPNPSPPSWKERIAAVNWTPTSLLLALLAIVFIIVGIVWLVQNVSVN